MATTLTLPELELVDCERRSLRLLERACVGDYRRVNAARGRPDPSRSDWHCWRCALGAECAGLPPPLPDPGTVCPRCRRRCRRIIDGRNHWSAFDTEHEARLRAEESVRAGWDAAVFRRVARCRAVVEWTDEAAS